MAFCGSNKAAPAQWFDSLGPDESGKHGTTGGRPLREQIFSYVPGMIDSGYAAGNEAAAAARAGAGMFSPVGAYGNKVLSGAYLNGSPALDRSLASTRAASDIAARNALNTARAGFSGQVDDTRSQLARSGMTYGTGNQQAAEASRAALEGALARSEAERVAQLAAGENQVRAQNYMEERKAQAQAPSFISAAAEKPFQLLSVIPSLQAGGLTPAAGLVGSLAGGGSASTDNYYKPGVFDHGLAALGTAASFDP